jgi:hypothetical protein
MSVPAIQDEIPGLPATERARLIDVLWDSIFTFVPSCRTGTPQRSAPTLANFPKRHHLGFPGKKRVVFAIFRGF